MELQKYSSVKRLTISAMFTPSSTPVIKVHRSVFGFARFEGKWFIKTFWGKKILFDVRVGTEKSGKKKRNRLINLDIFFINFWNLEKKNPFLKHKTHKILFSFVFLSFFSYSTDSFKLWVVGKLVMFQKIICIHLNIIIFLLIFLGFGSF